MKRIIGQPHFLQQINVEQIEQYIFSKGPISKPELAKLTGLSLPTVNKLVGILEAENKVKSLGLMGAGAGRKANVYVANKQSGNYIIIYFQNNEFICCVTDIVGGISYKYKAGCDNSSEQSALNCIIGIIEKLMSNANGVVKAVGIGVPGVVKKNYIITSIPSVPQFEGINLKKIIEEKFNIPTFVENDVKLTTVGYYHQNLKHKYKDMAYIYVGPGLGSGIILNKRLHKGFTSFAGELGYMVVEGVSDNKSFVTKGGVLESEIRAERNQMNNKDKISKLISYGIANLICTVNPQVIVLGGDLVTERLISTIKNNIKNIIPVEDEPIFIHDIHENTGIDGTINMCISNISSRFKVIDEKGV